MPLPGIGVALLIAGGLAVSGLYVQSRLVPGLRIADIAVGGLTKSEATALIEERAAELQTTGIRLAIDTEHGDESLPAETLQLTVDAPASIDQAWQHGRSGPWYRRIGQWLVAPVFGVRLAPSVTIDDEALRSEVEALAAKHDSPRTDVRYAVTGNRVTVLTDTAPGLILNQEEAASRIAQAVHSLSTAPVALQLVPDQPRVNPDQADEAREQAERLIAAPLTLRTGTRDVRIESTQLGSWITSTYTDDRLLPGLNEQLIAEYVAELAQTVNEEPGQVTVRVEGDRIVEFSPSKPGKVLQEKESTELIADALHRRTSDATPVQAIDLPFVTKDSLNVGQAAERGIVEELGTATTPFTGSPTNRVRNIQNGTKLLSGIVIEPDEEFSTIGALGAIDASQGFLPELVIKGDRTLPEFGGGLCQVSTTLFRAVLDAGLPVTSRKNHSYRVGYYEKDGEGRTIGPGLDATIYSPRPDFRFKNDTGKAILIQGVVEGDKVRFVLYGTRDGRVATVDGPKTLSVLSPGDAIYTETDTLPVGTTKQIETPHPGGKAVATYTVTYPDGRIEEQTFQSSYRPWPARFLVGTKTAE